MERMISLKTLFPRRISAIVVLLFMHIYNVEIHTYLFYVILLLILPNKINLKKMDKFDAERLTLMLLILTMGAAMLLWGKVFSKSFNFEAGNYDMKMILQGLFWLLLIVLSFSYKGQREEKWKSNRKILTYINKAQ